MRKCKAFFLKPLEEMQRCSQSSLLPKHWIGNISQNIYIRGNRNIRLGKCEVRLFLYTNVTIVYLRIGVGKESEKLLQWEFCKILGNKGRETPSSLKI